MSNINSKFIAILTLVASMVASVSCAKKLTLPDPVGPYGSEEDMVSVVFSANDIMNTKTVSPTASSESAINRWTIFAFDNSDGWMRYATSEDDEDIEMKLWPGREYTCYAIANYKKSGLGAFNPSTVTTAEGLCSRVAYLGDNAEGNLVMFGSKPVTPSARKAEDPAEPVSIPVRRLVSKVTIPSISVDFSTKPELASKSFVLRGIYITNAYRTSRYGSDFTSSELSGTRSAWYNTCGYHMGETGVELLDDILSDRNINIAITGTSPYMVSHSFYVFPNPIAKVNDDRQTTLWTPRCTRLVIEASIDSDIVYYQVDIPEMERNRLYSANNLTIHNRGSKDPEEYDVDPDTITVDFLISPTGWLNSDAVTENS